MSVYIFCSPLIMCCPLSYKVVCNTLGFLLQSRVRDCCICQDRLIVTIYEGGLVTGIHIIQSLYLRLQMYSQHCFIVINSEPKDEDSTLACFLLHQYTNALLMYTRKSVLEHQVTMSESWSASTFVRIVKPIP